MVLLFRDHTLPAVRHLIGRYVVSVRAELISGLGWGWAARYPRYPYDHFSKQQYNTPEYVRCIIIHTWYLVPRYTGMGRDIVYTRMLLSSHYTVLSTQRHQQYPQCPSWFFMLEIYKFCGYRQWESFTRVTRSYLLAMGTTQISSCFTKHWTKFVTHQTGNYPVTCFVSKPSRITFKPW